MDEREMKLGSPLGTLAGAGRQGGTLGGAELPSVAQLAERIRSGERSARDGTEACIDRIERLGPRLNALVADRFDEARAEADAADARRRSEPASSLPPLFGVPCTVKEAIAVHGMPHTAGVVARRHVTATKDATAVARLRAAGAIILGVSNVSELCLWMETASTREPKGRDPD